MFWGFVTSIKVKYMTIAKAQEQGKRGVYYYKVLVQ